MTVPEGFHRRELPDGHAVVHDALVGVPTERLWSPGAPLPGAAGRGGVGVLDLEGVGRAVTRPLRRGGLLRAWLPAAVADAERTARELVVLATLAAKGVPVVEPLAALARRRGRGYEQRLVTRCVEGASPLPAFVAASPQWRRAAVRGAGQVVGAAFVAGLRHPDLHPDNFIARAADGECAVWLLDLDRASCGGGPTAAADRDWMLLRMARYTVRHAARLPAVRGVDTLRFLAGLGLDRRRRRACVAALAPRLARAVRWHRLSWRS